MTGAHRRIMWPLVIMAVGAIWLLAAGGAIPETARDLLYRAWPALLFLFAFDVLAGRRQLRIRRINIEANWIGLVLTVALVTGVIWFAYRKQADVQRTENVQTLHETLGVEVARVRVDAQVMRTAITIETEPDTPDSLGATFAGSRESDVTIRWDVEGDTGVLTVVEEQRNAIPRLSDYGRGTLEIRLPTAVPVSVLSVRGDQGDVQADLNQLRVERLELAVDKGDVTLRLPTRDVMQGRLVIRQGDLQLYVPEGMALNVKLEPGSGEPNYEYDSFRYDLLRDGELKRHNVPAFQYVLNVWLKKGARLVVIDGS